MQLIQPKQFLKKYSFLLPISIGRDGLFNATEKLEDVDDNGNIKTDLRIFDGNTEVTSDSKFDHLYGRYLSKGNIETLKLDRNGSYFEGRIYDYTEGTQYYLF